MVGTRGVPARYGGFETAIEEVGSRLANRGHDVVVYCRGGDEGLASHLGMTLVHLPAVRRRSLETMSHTFASARHLRRQPPFDAVLLFNAANAFALPMIAKVAPGIALHVDGLEWQRSKWGPLGKTWYLLMERYGARRAAELIADARGIQDYYRVRYGAHSRYIAYGAPLIERREARRLAERGLETRRYDLVVARMEPENHTDLAIEAHLATSLSVPLVVVGSVPYESKFSDKIAALTAGRESVRMFGGVWDSDELDELYAHCRLYVHGHSVGGTNPALLRAMGAGAPIVAYDVTFNREVLGDAGRFFADAGELTTLMTDRDEHASDWQALGESARQRAATLYDWDQVADGYEALCRALAAS